MAVRVNPLFAMLAPPPRDFTDRLPAGVYNADERMVVQPYADPGYAMPNASEGNLNQSPGQVVGGYLPAGGADPRTAWVQQWLNRLLYPKAYE